MLHSLKWMEIGRAAGAFLTSALQPDYAAGFVQRANRQDK